MIDERTNMENIIPPHSHKECAKRIENFDIKYIEA
jgi:hypothetical protein